MRIISNFKDYYDSCLAYGADKSLVYTRKEKQQDLPKSYSFANDLYYEPERMKWGKLMDELRDTQRGGSPNKKLTDRSHEIVDKWHEVSNEISQILGE